MADAAKDYANTRYSGLSEITAENVGSLKLAWTFSTGVLRGPTIPISIDNVDPLKQFAVTAHRG